MAVAATKAKAPRTATRPEPEARMPERAPERDPNVILTRDGKPVDLGRVVNQTVDRLDLKAMGIIPEQGWTYEWRTRTVKNAPWTQQIVDDEQAGWTPVPASRHPGRIMPTGYEGPIEYNGLMLMERDNRLTAMARTAANRDANGQLKIARDMQGLMRNAAPNSGAVMDFENIEAQKATGVRTERIPMGDPNKNYQYTLDE